MFPLRQFNPGPALLLIALTLSTLSRAASVEVVDPWIRATVPGQQVAGAYMRLTAHQDMRLVGATSPVAERVELHFMRMNGDSMEMRALDTLDLPAGEPVDLSPGGTHAMLIGLKRPIRDGDRVPMTLTFEGPEGRAEHIDLRAEARAYR